MRREEEANARAGDAGRVGLGDRGDEPSRDRLDEARMVEIGPDLLDPDPPGEARRLEGAGQVLPVLPAAGIRGVGARVTARTVEWPAAWMSRSVSAMYGSEFRLPQNSGRSMPRASSSVRRAPSSWRFWALIGLTPPRAR
jgi:hypothetical protein